MVLRQYALFFVHHFYTKTAWNSVKMQEDIWRKNVWNTLEIGI